MHRLQNVSRLWIVLGYIFCSISGSAQVSFRLHFLREPVHQLFLQPRQINQLDCVYENTSEQVTHTWYLNDLPVNHEYIQDFPNGTLRFEIEEDLATSADQRRNLEGTYRCCISNSLHALCSRASTVLFPKLTKTCTFILLCLVSSALLTPTVIPSNRNGVIGETLRLFCNASGNPKPEVMWLKDSQLLQFDGSRVILLPNNAVQISSVVASDAAGYICSSQNVVAMLLSPTTTITVSAQTPSDPDTRGDILNVTETHVVGRIREDILLECMVRKSTEVEVVWTFGTKNIPDWRVEKLGKGNLLIKNATLDDNGTYTCTSIASDPITTRKRDVHLMVQAPPTLFETPLEYSEKSEGTLAVFHCKAEGNPKPEVIWYRDGERLTLGGRFSQSYSTSLWIYNLKVSDTGLYQCFVSNPLGSLYAISFLHINVSEFEPVRNLSASDIKSSSVFLSWILPYDKWEMEVVGVVIYDKWLPGGTENSHFIHGNDTMNTTLMNLRPYSNYSISVRVSLSIYLTRLTTIYIKTLESAPSAAPEIVELVATPTSVTVTWEHVDAEHQNGVLTEIVLCINQEADNIVEKCVQSEPSVTTYTASNLQPGQEYFFRIAAKTDAGQGPFSDVQPRFTPIRANCTAPDALPLKIKVVNSSFVSFSWNEPNNSHSGLILGYRLMIYRAKDGHRVDFLLLDANTKSYNKSNAGQSREYVVSFYAIGQCGDGPSTRSVIKIPEEITVDVNMPHDLRSQAISSDRIQLSWEAPDVSTNPSSYTVEYKALEGPVMHLISRVTWVTLRNLSPHTIYQMKVTANFTDSTSTSLLVYCRTLESIPGSPPSNVKVYAVDGTKLNVTWYPPVVPNGRITHYIVIYCSTRTISKGWQTVTVQAKDNQETQMVLELSNLEPDTEYTVKISASTSVGPGPSTSAHVAVTLSQLPSGKGPKLTDLRSGILTGVCLALICITVCVSLLVYHHRFTLCYRHYMQGHNSNVSTRIGTPSHARGGHGSRRKGEYPKHYSRHHTLSILTTEFEMEHLMRERQSNTAGGVALQVNRMDPKNIPARGAGRSDSPPATSAEEPFLEIHNCRLPPEEDTSQDIPQLIPQEDTSWDSTSCCNREVSHSRVGKKVQVHGNIGAKVRIDIVQGGREKPHCSSLPRGHMPSTSQEGHCSDRAREDPDFLYSTLSATSEKQKPSSSSSSLTMPTAAPQAQTCQPRDMAKEHCTAVGSHVEEEEEEEGACVDKPLWGHESDTSSLDRDSGLSGDLFGDKSASCDTSPDFLEWVMEELSDPVC